MIFKRYGIYVTPSDNRFADAGARWLGWDSRTGTRHSSPAPELTARPRKYGFHATMKPPFSLAPGAELHDLSAGLAALCVRARPVQLDGLEIRRMGSFLAFTAEGSTEELGALASRCVRDLDAFRAPPSEEELARRKQAHLTKTQEDNLRRWGYPHVMEHFRFHLTLTGSVPSHKSERVRATLRAHFADCATVPFRIDELTLVGEAEDGFFHEIERFPLVHDASSA